MQSSYKISGLDWVGATVGSIIYFDENDNGEVIGYLLAMPSDAATQRDAGTPYVLTTAPGVGGEVPAWRATAIGTVTSGYGNNYGNDFGGPA